MRPTFRSVTAPPGHTSTPTCVSAFNTSTYFNLYGGTSNFDGQSGVPGAGGTHNASGNNTLFLYAWAAF